MRDAVLRALVAAVGLLLVALMLVNWNALVWLGGPQATNDAQTRGDPVFVMSEVSGYVTADAVDDDQPVRRGQTLFRVEDDVSRAERDRAAAMVAQAEAAVRVSEAQIAAAGASVAVAGAGVAATQASLTYAREEQGRWNALANTAGDLLQQRQRANSEAESQSRTLESDRANVASAAASVREMERRLDERRATLLARRHELELAEISLRWTRVVAPADGVVGRRLVRPGQYVEPGRRLITFVPLPDIWVVAYYREEQVATMRVGQAVDIHVDAFPQHAFHGRIDSFEPTSQIWTQLFPPDRATGNFTKIVQRVPVKIVLVPPVPEGARLVPGLSVETAVLTGSASNAGPR